VKQRRSYGTILILGGGGMVGIQVARECARELRPAKMVIAAVEEQQAMDAIAFLRPQIASEIELIPEWGSVFVPEDLKDTPRDQLVQGANFEKIFDAVFRRAATAESSALYAVIKRYAPDIVVDAINTASAISYQNEFELAIQAKDQMDALASREGAIQREELEPLFDAVRKLMVAQGIPQITRHILLLHQALQDSGVEIYVKVGTTGTGGMGLNIPYTHSEDKPSQQLIAKSAIGFAHTGLLFLLARTPGGSEQDGGRREEKLGAIVKEVKPGAMIGFRRVEKRHIGVRGEDDVRQAHLLEPREDVLGDQLNLREDRAGFPRFEGRDVPLEIVGADTGENGFFSIGEFQAITFPRQMEYVTPEEVARTVVLEIIGASTGRDVLVAIDGAITEPSYRAGVLREHAIREMRKLEQQIRGENDIPSIAVGHLGPPRLSKLLAEAFLIRQAATTEVIRNIARIQPVNMKNLVEAYLAANPIVTSTIVRIGTPILRERDGKLMITRGPRINIPPVVGGRKTVDIPPDHIDDYANAGWVDLRVSNFAKWQKRLSAATPGDIQQFGSAAFDANRYPGERFEPGDFVGWLFVNEPDELGMIGGRLY